jgi:putative flippase GtrA
MRKRLLPSRQTQVRFLRFFTVGGIAFVVNVASFALFKFLLPPNVAFTLAFILSVATHYSLNRFWALPSTRSDTIRQALEYLCTTCVSYLISFSAFKLFSSVLGIGLGWSQALSVPPATVVVFFILNYWVFHHRGNVPPRSES